MTKYIVLSQVTRAGVQGDPTTGEGTTEVVSGSFVVVGEVEAQTDVAAIKAISKEMRDNPDVIEVDLSNGAVAVPARSWRVRKPERKVEERTLWN